MTWRPAMVALDVDGCLLEWEPGTDKSDERVSPAVYAAVQRVVAAGVPVVLASGRAALGLDAVARLLDLPSPGWLAASNGAVVASYAPLLITRGWSFDARPVVERVLTDFPEAMIAVEDPGTGYQVNRPFPRGELSAPSTVLDPRLLGRRRATRVMVRHPEGDAPELSALARELGLDGTDYVAHVTSWLDIAPVGVDKASGLTVVAERLGIDPAETLAIGDGGNDIEMLRWAGRGVAMGQAAAEVRAAADAVTAAVDADGVAVELDRWFAQ